MTLKQTIKRNHSVYRQWYFWKHGKGSGSTRKVHEKRKNRGFGESAKCA